MGLKEVFYSYLVPEMIWKKFHGNRMPGSANTKLPLLNLTSWVKVLSPFGCWCFHLIQNSSFANLLCCRGGLDWQMVCLFRKPQNGCGVTIFSNNKTKHLTSCCSENLIHKQDIKGFFWLILSLSPSLHLFSRYVAFGNQYLFLSTEFQLRCKFATQKSESDSKCSELYSDSDCH